MSVVLHDESDVLHDESDVLHDESDVLHDESDVLHDESNVLHDESDVLHDESNVLHDESDVLHDESDVLHDESDVLHDESDVLHDESDVLHDESDVLHDESDVLHDEPDVLHDEPDVLHDESVVFGARSKRRDDGSPDSGNQMNNRDKKRLLEAFLKHRRRILTLAKRYAEYFRAEPEDLVQATWVILARRPSFGPDEDVVWRAQDAMRNLVKNRRRSGDRRHLRFFSRNPTAPIEDYAENEWIDEAGEDFDDENLHGHPGPNPERALLEKERVEIYRVFLAELKELLDPVERAIVEAGEKDADDTTDLQRQLECTRDRIYKARFTIKQKGLKLRERWAAAGRELPGFDERVARQDPAVVVNIKDREKS